MHEETLAACRALMAAWIAERGETSGAPSLPLATAREHFGWPAPLMQRVLQQLEQEGTVRMRGDALLVGGDLEGLDPEDRRIAERLIGLYEETGFRSPRPDELPELTGASGERIRHVLDYLCRDGRLMRLDQARRPEPRRLPARGQDMVIREIEEHGVLDSSDFKYRIGSSRKYALAILDALDARHVTRRIGNDRKLNADYERHRV